MDACQITQHKENIQPLRSGREVKRLTYALQATSDCTSKQKLSQEQDQYEMKLREGNEEEDPLDVWTQYIHWLEQTQPAQDNKNLKKILFKCIKKFRKDEKYKNDTRFVKICMRFAQQQPDSIDYFVKLWSNGIGTRCAYFYVAWAETFVLMENIKNAEKVYEKGINYLAQPIELLKDSQRNFHAYLSRKLVNADEVFQKTTTLLDIFEPTAELAAARQAYNELIPLTTRDNQKITPNIRVGSNVSGAAVRLKQKPVETAKNKKTITIYEDTEEPSSLFKSPLRKSKKIQPYGKMTKENVKKAGVWTNPDAPNVPFAISGSSRLPFEFHVDEDTVQYSESNNKALTNALKPIENEESRLASLKEALFVEEAASSSGHKWMCCKDKLYAGNTEFQFEELRAMHYWKRMKLMKKFEAEDVFVDDDEDKENAIPKDYTGPSGKSTRPTSGILTPAENVDDGHLSNDEDFVVTEDDEETEDANEPTLADDLNKTDEDSPLDLTVSKANTSDFIIDVPFSVDFIGKTLQKINLASLGHLQGFHVSKEPGPRLAIGYPVLLDHTYELKTILRDGSFGKLYRAQNVSTGENKSVKTQNNTLPWEFYIIRELHNRLNNPEFIIQIDRVFFYTNELILIGNALDFGDLMTVLNNFKSRQTSNKLMSDYLMIYFTAKMLSIVDAMHSCNIIHGDLRPELFFVRKNDESIYLQLVEFSSCVDLNLFPDGTVFNFNDDRLSCVEMPCSFEADYVGLASCIYFLLFGDKIDVVKTEKGWNLKRNIPRYWSNCWREIFILLLNSKGKRLYLKELQDKMNPIIAAATPNCDYISLSQFLGA